MEQLRELFDAAPDDPASLALLVALSAVVFALIVMSFAVLVVALRRTGTPSAPRGVPQNAAVPIDHDGDLRAVLRADGFREMSPLGGGGIASVYYAERRNPTGHDRDVSGPCAVKVLKPAFRKDRDVFKKFLHEGAILRRIERRGAAQSGGGVVPVVRCIDSGIVFAGEQQIPFLQLEWIGGPGLDEVLARAGGMQWRRAVAIARRVAQGLALAHEDNILHRDISPANVMFTDATCRDIRLIDFGVAKLEHLETQVGHLYGKPLYMAPELFEQHGTTAEASEMWALGVVLYEMIAGRHPFARKTDHFSKVLGAIKSRPAPALGGDTPPAVSALIAGMLNKDPAARTPRNMWDFVRESKVLIGNARAG